MLPRVIRRLGSVGTTLSAALVLAACGSNTPGATNNGGSTATPTAAAGGTTYTVAGGDLCAKADFASLKAVVPVVKDLKPQQRTFNDTPVFHCDGDASKSNEYKDIGFISLSAYTFSTKDAAAEYYQSYYGTPRGEEPQPVTGVGEQGVSYWDGILGVGLAVQDGNLLFLAKWTANSPTLATALRDKLRPALVATARATLSNLKVP